MSPRHWRTQPFVIRTRSFWLTWSISSFHKLRATESPSSSVPFASHTRDCPRKVLTLRVSPFSVIVRSRTSNLLSALRSFTFMGKPRSQRTHALKGLVEPREGCAQALHGAGRARGGKEASL